MLPVSASEETPSQERRSDPDGLLLTREAPDGSTAEPAPTAPSPDPASPEQPTEESAGPPSGESSRSEQPAPPAGETAAPHTEPAPPATTAAAEGPVFFDDFDYTGHDDPRLARRGWWVRNTAGGPGLPGAVWAPENVTFATADGNSVLNLEAGTDGTAAGSRHAEIQQQEKFHNGTYAARVRFSDAPRSGPDGDELVQSFFAITSMDLAQDETYGETDFEYLPNGGWGTRDHSMWTTSWENYRPSGTPHNTSDKRVAGYAGWHDLLLTIDDSAIRYSIDGELFAVHNEPFLPEAPMAIDFNQWFITDGLVGAEGARSYDQKVDYVFHAKDQVLTADEVQAQVSAYRADGVRHLDTVPKT